MPPPPPLLTLGPSMLMLLLLVPPSPAKNGRRCVVLGRLSWPTAGAQRSGRGSFRCLRGSKPSLSWMSSSASPCSEEKLLDVQDATSVLSVWRRRAEELRGEYAGQGISVHGMRRVWKTFLSTDGAMINTEMLLSEARRLRACMPRLVDPPVP